MFGYRNGGGGTSEDQPVRPEKTPTKRRVRLWLDETTPTNRDAGTGAFVRGEEEELFDDVEVRESYVGWPELAGGVQSRWCETVDFRIHQA